MKREKEILVYCIKGYIRIILNLKYSYLKITVPEQMYAFPFCMQLVTQTLSLPSGATTCTLTRAPDADEHAQS